MGDSGKINDHPIMNDYRLRTRHISTFDRMDTDWARSASTPYAMSLPLNKAAKAFEVPLQVAQGEKILGYRVVGRINKAAGTTTLDAAMFKLGKNATPGDAFTATALGAITQQTADGEVDAEKVLATPEVVAADKGYILIVTGTCSNDVGNVIDISHIELDVLEPNANV